MCTSIFTKTEDNKHFLARTMDFSFPLDGNPVFLPRDYNWHVFGKEMTNKYAMLGTGRGIAGNYIFTDGINEHGLAMAELYLPGEASYNKKEIKGKNNLAPWEFLNWVLGNYKSIKDLEKDLKNIRLIDKEVPILNKSIPLHYIFADKTGKVVVIEPTGGELKFKENPVGVMTNTPNLEWHTQNLRNYLGIQPKQFSSKKYGEFTATPFSQGTGTSHLPGSFTPADRFVRAAFFKEYINKAKNEEEGVTNIWQILSTVRIPKGIVIEDSEGEDFTQYLAAMCLENRSFYFTSYENNQITKAELTDELIENGDIVIFEVQRNQSYYAPEGTIDRNDTITTIKEVIELLDDIKTTKKGQIEGKNKEMLKNVDEKFLNENISSIKEFLDIIEKSK
ncbi:choloylglycine hydrolase family protein [Methanobrevibacter sp.]|uniref:choloylglycine hydrolase family protein n=1 Tax=Methanobrevibacter sp. TaxID=66852 RepID=UPI0026159DD1|nr:choloylglycine hydrolase family protein [uncultured Methanobrevibacter sp.]